MKTSSIVILAVLTCIGASDAITSAVGAASPSETQTASSNSAEPAPPPAGPAKKSAAELEKLVMPIALHPDPLVAILLPAAAYPLEIVQAARFVKDTNNIPKVDEQPWDDNVKEVAKFPELIAKMDADLPWTMELGEAFVNQPKELMDTIQDLRGKAKKAGTLQSSSQQVVSVTNVVVYQTNITEVTSVTKEIVQVAPANPQVVYVPTYPPTVYYPPPGYVYNPIAPLVSFGVGMAWGAVLANNCNWGHGSVDVDIDRNVNRNVNRNTSRSGNVNSTGARSGQQQWKPNQTRMNQSGAASANSLNSRGYGGSGAKPSTGNVGNRPSTGNAAARPSTGNAAARPSTGGGASARPSTGTAGSGASAGGAGARPSTSQSAGRSSSPSASNRSSSSGSAFSGSGSGNSARASSSRGAASRGGGGGGGRGGGGGGRR